MPKLLWQGYRRGDVRPKNPQDYLGMRFLRLPFTERRASGSRPQTIVAQRIARQTRREPVALLLDATSFQ